MKQTNCPGRGAGAPVRKALTFVCVVGMAFSLIACGTEDGKGSPTGKPPATEAAKSKPTLTLIGQSSLKIKTAEGIVVYVDPYYQGDYSEAADIILVSHEHSDHNKIELCTQKEGTKVLGVKDTINQDNSYNSFEYFGVKIEPVPASNKNHPLSSTNGFLITFDGITLYHASDTSKLDRMVDLSARNIDYAFFPIDGQYNMGPAEAMECAKLVGAKHNTPFHVNRADVKAFAPENLLRVAYGETIELVAQPR